MLDENYLAFIIKSFKSKYEIFSVMKMMLHSNDTTHKNYSHQQRSTSQYLKGCYCCLTLRNELTKRKIKVVLGMIDSETRFCFLMN